jgi:hypothetical protein
MQESIAGAHEVICKVADTEPRTHLDQQVSAHNLPQGSRGVWAQTYFFNSPLDRTELRLICHPC